MFEREPGHDPRKNLWQAVLLRTVEDALLGVSQESNRETRINACKEARDYLTRPSADLSEVCALAGMDMQAVIEHMRGRIANAPTPEELADNPQKPVSTFVKAPKKPKVKRVPFGAKIFTINGKTRTAAEWCDKTGIPLTLARSRIYSAWLPERAFFVTREQARQEHRDRARQAFGLTSEERSARIKDGLRRSEALHGKPKRGTMPVQYECDGQSHSLAEWAEITGVKKSTLYKRVVLLGWPIGEALTRDDRRSKRGKKVA